LGSRVPLHVVGAVAFASLISGLKGLTLSPGLWEKGKTPGRRISTRLLADGRRLNMRMLCENV